MRLLIICMGLLALLAVCGCDEKSAETAYYKNIFTGKDMRDGRMGFGDGVVKDSGVRQVESLDAATLVFAQGWEAGSRATQPTNQDTGYGQYNLISIAAHESLDAYGNPNGYMRSTLNNRSEVTEYRTTYSGPWATTTTTKTIAVR